MWRSGATWPRTKPARVRPTSRFSCLPCSWHTVRALAAPLKQKASPRCTYQGEHASHSTAQHTAQLAPNASTSAAASMPTAWEIIQHHSATSLSKSHTRSLTDFNRARNVSSPFALHPQPMVPPDQGTHLITLATANKPHLGDSHTPREREGGVTSLVLLTPIRVGQLSTWLEGFHQADRGTLVRGFQIGFDVGYDDPHRVTQCANLKSALELPHIIDNKIKRSLAVLPKKQHGSYRLMHHLSHPAGSSINENIPHDLCTVQYQTIVNMVPNVHRNRTAY